jgi:hypothetical protein
MLDHLFCKSKEDLSGRRLSLPATLYLYSLAAKNLLHVEEILVDDASRNFCFSSFNRRETFSALHLRAID